MKEKNLSDSDNCLLKEQRNAVLWLTFNRPDKYNSLSHSLIEELRQSLQTAAADDQIRVVVLTGNGPSFCIGADLEALGGVDGKQASPDDFLDVAFSLNSELRNFPKPIIAALNGLTCAGGLEIAMCCDLIVSAESVKVGDAHSNFAAFPGGGGACMLPRRIGLARAKYLLFTGDLIPVMTMKDWGLINEVVADVELLDFVDRLAERIAEKSPAVMKAMKYIADRTEHDDLTTGLKAEQSVLRRQVESADFHEGIAAFREKRKPVFKDC